MLPGIALALLSLSDPPPAPRDVAPKTGGLPRPAGQIYRSPLGFSLELPPGFAPAALPLGSTAALAPGPPGARQTVEAAFSDGPGPREAALAVIVVDAPLDLGPGSPERLAALTIDFTRDRLDGEFHIEWAETVPTARGQALELAGRLSFDSMLSGEPADHAGAAPSGEERMAQFAFVPLGERQIVLSASLPAARFVSLSPQLERSLSTLAVNLPPSRIRQRAVLAVTMGALFWVVALAVWRVLRRPPAPAS